MRTKAAKKNEIGKAQIELAKQLGIESFQNGKCGTPILNKKVIEIVGYRMPKDTPAGEASFIDVCKAYSSSWVDCNLANARKLFLKNK